MQKLEVDLENMRLTVTATISNEADEDEEWSVEIDIPALLVRQIPRALEAKERESTQWVEINGSWVRALRVRRKGGGTQGAPSR